LNRSWAGPAITGLIVLGVVAILATNFQTSGTPKPAKVTELATAAPPVGANVQENPIGDPITRNHVEVAAVWLAGVTMDGMPSMGGDVIHLEADIKSTADNPNGFAKSEFVPYLKVKYALTDVSAGKTVDSGEMMPMIASDGLHYGASIAMPKPGSYRLTYHIEPPSAGGLGRHVGAGGVAPWWEPFDASFDWTVEPKTAPALAGNR